MSVLEVKKREFYTNINRTHTQLNYIHNKTLEIQM